jgi:hypothetical protein
MNICDFPNEILLHIIKYVDNNKYSIKWRLRQLLRVKAVCKLFSELIYLHPFMRIIRQYEESEISLDEINAAYIYAKESLPTKIAKTMGDCITEKLEFYNNIKPFPDDVTFIYNLITSVGGFQISKKEVISRFVHIEVEPNIINENIKFSIKFTVNDNFEVITKLNVFHKSIILHTYSYDLSLTNICRERCFHSLQRLLARNNFNDLFGLPYFISDLDRKIRDAFAKK